MLKFLIGIIVIAFSTFCGYLFGRKYRQRKLFFSQFKEFNERFLSEIAYSRRPIKQFIASFPYKDEFHDLLQRFCENMERASQDQHGVDTGAYSFLKAEERRVIEDYFQMLGKGDSVSQKGYFSSVKDTLSKLQAETESAAKRYGDLYLKLGFLLGLFILILII